MRILSYGLTKDDVKIMNLLSISCSFRIGLSKHDPTVNTVHFHSPIASVDFGYLAIQYSANIQPIRLAEANQQEKVLSSMMAVPSNIMR